MLQYFSFDRAYPHPLIQRDFAQQTKGQHIEYMLYHVLCSQCSSWVIGSFNPNVIPHACTLMQWCIMHAATKKVISQSESSKRGFSMKGHVVNTMTLQRQKSCERLSLSRAFEELFGQGDKYHVFPLSVLCFINDNSTVTSQICPTRVLWLKFGLMFIQ